MLVQAVRRVTASPATMRSRVLGKLLIGLSQDGGVTFGQVDIYALDAATCGIAAELIEGRHNGWWLQPEWDDVRESIEAMTSTAVHPGQ